MLSFGWRLCRAPVERLRTAVVIFVYAGSCAGVQYAWQCDAKCMDAVDVLTTACIRGPLRVVRWLMENYEI